MKKSLPFLFLLIACCAFGQGSGEVIITEIYNRPLKPTQAQLDAAISNNPAGADTSPNEGHTEWFEVYNTTSQDIDMEGWIITDASSSSKTSTITGFTLAANSYAVFSGFNIPEAQGGVIFDYFYDYKQPSFNNESSYADAGDNACPDGVILQKADSSLVDEVLYDYGYGEYIGNPDAGDCTGNTAAVGIPAAGSSSRVSFMLIGNPDVMNSADNDLAANWAYSTLPYDVDGGQIGTPGAPNGGFVSGGGTGEVIITEIYNRPLKPTEDQLAAALPNNPAGADTEPNEGHTEWFEVYNTTNQDVVMDGWIIGDASSSSRSSTITSFTLPANSYAVFSGFNIPEAQGGYEFDYFYDYKKPSFNNESSYADPGDKSCPDGVSLTNTDGNLVDEVLYDYGYGEYIGNPDAGSCMDNTAAIGLPAAGSSGQVSFMLNVDPAVMNAGANDLPSNWIYSTNVYDEIGGQTGTPGLPNDAVTVSNKDIFLSEKVSIFPNPSSTIMTVETELTEDFTIGLFDLFGKNISENEVGDNNIDVSQIPNGMYLVRLKFEEGNVTKKITVQH